MSKTTKNAGRGWKRAVTRINGKKAEATKTTADRNWAVQVSGFGLSTIHYTGTLAECELAAANQRALNMGGFVVEIIYHK
jgi:hypothetical protein